MKGFLRKDGRKGIRNITAVVYLVECAHHVAREIVFPFRDQQVHLIGFPGCYPNSYAYRMVRQLCTHPNVGAALLVSLGCEGFNRAALLEEIRASGRPADAIVIQQEGGTRKTIAEGHRWIRAALEQLAATPTTEMGVSDLIIGTVCGGSDATSGITANPAVGRAFDRLIAEGAGAIFEETGELIGCEAIMAARAARPELAPELLACVDKAARYYTALGHGSFAPGNAEGGLTTQEEKSMGAYCKSGNSPIDGILKPGDVPDRGGLPLEDLAGVDVHVVAQAAVGFRVGADLDHRRNGGAHHRTAPRRKQRNVRTARDELADFLHVADVGEAPAHLAVGHDIQ